MVSICSVVCSVFVCVPCSSCILFPALSAQCACACVPSPAHANHVLVLANSFASYCGANARHENRCRFKASLFFASLLHARTWITKEHGKPADTVAEARRTVRCARTHLGWIVRHVTECPFQLGRGRVQVLAWKDLRVRKAIRAERKAARERL